MSDPILDAWLHVIARDGWSFARLDRVAIAAGTSAGDVAEALPDRWAALTAFGDRIDRTALAEAGDDPDADVRDRLFALLMARFDAAEPHKAAMRELQRAARGDPGLIAFGLARLPRSIRRIAEAAGIDTAGLLGPARVQVLTLLVLDVGRKWLADEDRDLAATMKALDTRLRQAERLARMVPDAVSAAAPPPAGDRLAE